MKPTYIDDVECQVEYEPTAGEEILGDESTCGEDVGVPFGIDLVDDHLHDYDLKERSHGGGGGMIVEKRDGK